jgi:hypothetical protein
VADAAMFQADIAAFCFGKLIVKIKYINKQS